MKTVDRTPHLAAPVETHLVSSRAIADEFKIQIALPPFRTDRDQALPIIYATDANATFDVLKGLAWSLQDLGRGLPPFLLVGIGYPSDHPAAGLALRMRDMTFPGYPEFELPKFDGVLQGCGARPHGAGALQEFLRSEIFPLVERRCGGAPGQRIYFGHSLGAGFGLHTLFTCADLFSTYLLSSPGVSYDGVTSAGIHYKSHDFLIDAAKTWIESSPALSATGVYLTVGSEEDGEEAYRNWRLTTGVRRLSKMFAAADIPGMNFKSDIFFRETHASAWPLAFTRGVRAALGCSKPCVTNRSS